MNIEIEQLKLKLIETQMAVLQYQHRDVTIAIEKITAIETQAKFDAAVDARNMPSGGSFTTNKTV
jgi:hypothetical protein